MYDEELIEHETLGEWSETIKAFHFGANGLEFIAWKGSHQVFVFDCDTYPQPPCQILQYTNRIETLDDFTNAIYKGRSFDVIYKDSIADWQR